MQTSSCSSGHSTQFIGDLHSCAGSPAELHYPYRTANSVLPQSIAPKLKSSMAPKLKGSKAQRLHGSMAPWLHGSMAPWLQGSKAPRRTKMRGRLWAPTCRLRAPTPVVTVMGAHSPFDTMWVAIGAHIESEL